VSSSVSVSAGQDYSYLICTRTPTDTHTRLFLRINQVDGVTGITGLGARMGLVAMITGLHGGSVGPGRAFIMLQVAMAIDAQRLFLSMEFMGYKYDPDRLQVGLFPLGMSA